MPICECRMKNLIRHSAFPLHSAFVNRHFFQHFLSLEHPIIVFDLMTKDQNNMAPPPIVALAAWGLPGAGYWMIGQRNRGLTIGITIILLFLMGLLIGGVRVMDAPALKGGGSLLHEIGEKPWFIGQVLAGPISLISAWLANAAAASPVYRDIVSHSRVSEIGTLYTAVAGMLNLLAIIDSSWRAGQRGTQ